MDFTDKNEGSSSSAARLPCSKFLKTNIRLKNRCREILAEADITINGKNPWDIQVHEEDFYQRVFSDDSLGLGESYMDGWWDCEALDQFFFLVLQNDLRRKVASWKDVFMLLKSSLFNFQKLSRAFQVGEHHYDIGNELYHHMLDRRMIYSCGYWKDATTLDQAQEAKLELICAKLQLKPGMRLLDIGCGWGGLAAYAAEKHGVAVTGVTVSKEQAEYARAHYNNLPVTINLKDYREMVGSFDRVVSVGMFEHVGYKNYRIFMKCVKKLLTSDGLALLHTIGGNKSVKCLDKWVSRYIFPNSMLPSAKQITSAIEGLFFIEDWQIVLSPYGRLDKYLAPR